MQLKHLGEINEERRLLAERYTKEIHNKKILLPSANADTVCVWHQYVIRCGERSSLINYLAQKGISTIIHYPIPPHLSEAYQYLGYRKGDLPLTEKMADTVLSIPLYNGMTYAEQSYVINTINEFQ